MPEAMLALEFHSKARKRELITDDTIEVAKQMGAYEDVRLGFIIDNIRYHFVEYDVHRKGYWASKAVKVIYDSVKKMNVEVLA